MIDVGQLFGKLHEADAVTKGADHLVSRGNNVSSASIDKADLLAGTVVRFYCR
jgi:hypothetical protein